MLHESFTINNEYNELYVKKYYGSRLVTRENQKHNNNIQN